MSSRATSSHGSFQSVSSSRYLKVLRRLASSNSLKSLCFSQVQPDVSTKNARELANVSFSKPDGRSALFRQMVVQICSIRSRPLSTLSSQSRQTPRDEPKMETIQVRFLKKNVSQPLVYFDPLHIRYALSILSLARKPRPGVLPSNTRCKKKRNM